jgi:hypothetical protein
MKKFAVLAAAVAFAAGALAISPKAEARRGFGWGGGIVAAAVIGGIIAASVASRRRHYGYGYYPRRNYYYGPSYAYAAPVYYRRAYRPARVYYGGFYHRGHRHGHYRRWR